MMSPKQNPLLIVAAAEFEVAPLTAELSRASIPFDTFEIGVGPIRAAKRAPELRARAQGRRVVYVGTCGVFGPFEGVEVVTSNSAVWLPYGSRTGRAELIEGVYPSFDIAEDPLVQGLRQVGTICSSEICLDSTLPGSIAASGAWVENLELYSVCDEIAASCDGFAVFLGITNAVGPDGRRQWKHNFRQAAQASGELIASRLSGLRKES